MSLHHHRAPCRQRGSGVSTCDRECQGEVARAEHRYRADADLAEPQVGARCGLPVGYGAVDPRTDEIAAAYNGREQAQLADGASAFPFQTCTGKAGFGHGALDQSVAKVQDVGGNRLEECGALFQAGVAKNREGSGRLRTGFLDIGGDCTSECGFQLRVRSGVRRIKRFARPGAVFAADKEFSSQHDFEPLRIVYRCQSLIGGPFAPSTAELSKCIFNVKRTSFEPVSCYVNDGCPVWIGIVPVSDLFGAKPNPNVKKIKSKTRGVCA